MNLSFGVTFQPLARDVENAEEKRWAWNMLDGQELRLGKMSWYPSIIPALGRWKQKSGIEGQTGLHNELGANLSYKRKQHSHEN